MNEAFNEISRSFLKNVNSSESLLNAEDFEKIKVNVRSNWTGKSLPSINLSLNSSNNTEEEESNFTGLKSFNVYLSDDDKYNSVNEYNDNVPDSIEGSYKYDFNIMEIHDVIMKKFKKQKSREIDDLKLQIKKEKERMKSRQNIIERKVTIKKIQQLEQKINSIRDESDFRTYINKIGPLIEEYNIMGTLSKIVSFSSSKKKDEDSEEELPEEPEIQEKRHEIIFDFLEIARKYIELDVIREVKDGNICPTCSEILDEEDLISEENGTIVCPNCLTEKISVVRARFYKDNTRTNNSGNNYEDRANFEKVLMRFQGKQPDKPPPELYESLERYFTKYKLPLIDIHSDGFPTYVSSNYIKNHLPLNSAGEKDGTSRGLMYKALKDSGNSRYYDHINIILHVMWGWELPDVSHLELQIMDDYDKSQRIYEILPKDRKSSLNSQFRLFKHLRRLGYNCKSSNFRIPTTHDILEFHENIWAKICEELEWENN